MTAIYSSTLDHAYIIGLGFLTRLTRSKLHPHQETTGRPWRQLHLRSGKRLWKKSLQACRLRVGSCTERSLVFKVRPDGLYKSRFCEQGFIQVAETDFGSTCAPGCRIPSVRIVLATATSHDWNVIQLDVRRHFFRVR